MCEIRKVQRFSKIWCLPLSLALALLPACADDEPEENGDDSSAHDGDGDGDGDGAPGHGDGDGDGGNTGDGDGDGDGDDVDCSDTPSDMVCVPAGGFEMGSMEEPDEQPIRQVILPTYFIDTTEVTVSQFGACVAAGECEPPGTGERCNWEVVGRDNHPVNCVDWNQAVAYCHWVGKRLPTEAEWEKAARGSGARIYPWGDDVPTCDLAAMYQDGTFGCGNDSTMDVGSKSPAGDSPYGAQDMAGNLWEWCSDWYAGSYDPDELDNPQGPLTGEYRVIRGGSFYNLAGLLRSSIRDSDDVGSSYEDYGFRCAR